MRSVRAVALKVLAALALVLLSGVVLPVVSEFFIELAKERGLYDNPSMRFASVMDALATATSSWWFALLLGFVLAGALALLVFDYWLRQMEPKRSAESAADQMSEPAVSARALPEDAPNKLAAIDQAMEMFGFNKRLHTAVKRGRELRAIWEQEIGQGRLDEYLTSLSQYSDEIWNLIRDVKTLFDESEKYTDIQDLVASGHDLLSKGYESKFVYSMGAFKDNMKRLGRNPTPNHLQLFKPYADSFRIAINEVEEWRTRTSDSLLSLRRELSN